MRKTIVTPLIAVLLSPSLAFADPRGQVEELAATLAAHGQTAAAEQIERVLAAVSDAELEAVYGPLSERMTELTQTIGSLPTEIPVVAPDPASRSAGLPTAPYSAECGSTRANTDDLFIAKVAVQVAGAAVAAASNVCNQVIVAIGVGGNTSLACLPLDIALAVLEDVLENIEFCVADIDSAEILGTRNRIAHLHTDLATAKASLDALEMSVDMLDAQISAAQDDLAVISRTQAEQALALLGGTRMAVMYTDRIDEVCSLATSARTHADTLYNVSPRAGALLAAAAGSLGDPKERFDLCRDAYRLSTYQSQTLR